MFLIPFQAAGAPTCEPQVCNCAHNAGHDIVESKLYSAICAVICLVCASMASGMSVGFSSMDRYELQVLIAANEDDCQSVEEKEKLVAEKKMANLILPTLNKGNKLLVTFVIVTAAANEALPLFLDQLFPEWIACLLSVLLVIFVCEMLPALMFRRGPHQMRLSSYMIPLVKVLMFVLSPVGTPVANLLDFLIAPGEAETSIKYTRAQMNAMLNMHVVTNDETDPSASSSGLARKEVHAIQTIISSRVVWKTMYKVQVIHADSIFIGAHQDEQVVQRGVGSRRVDGQPETIGFQSLWKTGERDDHLLVKDDERLIGSVSAADLAADHARHGDRLIREFKLKKLVFLDTATQDPALFDVLCGMTKADANFTICGSPENPEGFVSMKCIVAQLVCDNDRQALPPCSLGYTRRHTSPLANVPDASQLKELQRYALQEMKTAEELASDDSGNENDATDNEEDEDVAHASPVPESVKRRLLERRQMFSMTMD